MKLKKFKTTSLMEQLVPIYISDKGIQVVHARELHHALGVKKKFADWIKANLKSYTGVDFVDDKTLPLEGNSGIDYVKVEVAATQGKGKSTEYILTLDTAKELAMMSKCENGKNIRRYFIEIEKAYVKTISVMTDTKKTDKEKIAEALLIANNVLEDTKVELKKANRNKAYNKKVNVQLRRRVKELQIEIENANNNPKATQSEIKQLVSKLEETERQVDYWESAHAQLEIELDNKSTQLKSILKVKNDGKKYFNILSAKHAAVILERSNDKKMMKANMFRKSSIEACKDIKYSQSFAANFIEKIHPLSLPLALKTYFSALQTRLESDFYEVVGEDLILEIMSFLEENQELMQ